MGQYELHQIQPYHYTFVNVHIVTWGILIMYYIAYGCSFLDGTKAWRVPWGLQMLPAVFLGVGLFFCPESPR